MGGCTSKQERRTKPSGKEMEKVMFDKLRGEVKRLRKKMEEEREYWKWVVVEERATRDEAVEKWKQLYLAIKNELDHLIIIHHTTTTSSYSGEERKLKTMEEELRDEVRAKEETIETLKERLALMERQKYEKEREIDLLRQSLRILGSNNKKKKKKKTMNLLILKTKCV